MSPPPDERRRPFTLPPVPPPSDIPSRVWMLERDLGEIKEALTGQKLALDDIKNQLIVITTQRTAEEKRRDHWMKIVVGIATSVAVAALGALATFMGMIQHAKMPP